MLVLFQFCKNKSYLYHSPFHHLLSFPVRLQSQPDNVLPVCTWQFIMKNLSHSLWNIPVFVRCWGDILSSVYKTDVNENISCFPPLLNMLNQWNRFFFLSKSCPKSVKTRNEILIHPPYLKEQKREPRAKRVRLFIMASSCKLLWYLNRWYRIFISTKRAAWLALWSSREAICKK